MIDDVVRASNALTARWARHAFTGEAGALSGAGLWPLLALLAAAADGAGRHELQEAIGRDAAGADRAARDLLEVLARGTAIDGAFGLWSRADVPLEQWWLDAAPDGSRGELTGDSGADRARLDAWAERHTRGRLHRMPVDTGPDTLMVLATALSIDTRWRQPFQNFPFRPRSGPWAAPADGPGGRFSIGLNRSSSEPGEAGSALAGLTRSGPDVDRVALAETPGGPLTVLTVEGEDDVDVHLCLGEPDRPAGEVLSAGAAALDGEHPLRPGSALLDGPPGPKGPGVELSTVRAFTPEPALNETVARFEVSAEHDLLARPELFGLATVSTDDPRGHFPRISRTPLKIEEGAQDVTAAFSAEGFKAAAVTAFSMAPAGVPALDAPVLNATFDRPFGFLARHRPTGLVLVAGWVAEPQDWPDDTATPW